MENNSTIGGIKRTRETCPPHWNLRIALSQTLYKSRRGNAGLDVNNITTQKEIDL